MRRGTAGVDHWRHHLLLQSAGVVHRLGRSAEDGPLLLDVEDQKKQHAQQSCGNDVREDRQAVD